MLAHPKKARCLWPAGASLRNLRCVVTKMGYNQTRVCWHVACPSGASDNVPSSPHGSLLSTPPYQSLPLLSLQPSFAVQTVLFLSR